MTLTQSMQLGDAGAEILHLLKDVKECAIQRKSIDGYEFEDEAHQAEYIEDTIEMIINQLTKLTLKQ